MHFLRGLDTSEYSSDNADTRWRGGEQSNRNANKSVFKNERRVCDEERVPLDFTRSIFKDGEPI